MRPGRRSAGRCSSTPARPAAAVMRVAMEGPGGSLTLRSGDDSDAGDFGRGSALPLVRRPLLRGARIEIVVPREAMARAGEDALLPLYGLSASGARARVAF